VDRARFLLLATALAESGCTPNPPARPAVVEPTKTVPSGSVSAPVTDDDPWSWLYRPYDVECCPPMPNFIRSCCPPYRGKSCFVAGPASGPLRIDPMERSCVPRLARARGQIDRYIQGNVGEDIMLCLSRFGESDCYDEMILRCVQPSLHAACFDSAVDAQCEQLATTCKLFALDACRSYLSGLTQSGRDALAACLADNQCTLGPGDCLLRLLR
jgi:hypothetical protein